MISLNGNMRAHTTARVGAAILNEARFGAYFKDVVAATGSPRLNQYRWLMTRGPKPLDGEMTTHSVTTAGALNVSDWNLIWAVIDGEDATVIRPDGYDELFSIRQNNLSGYLWRRIGDGTETSPVTFQTSKAECSASVSLWVRRVAGFNYAYDTGHGDFLTFPSLTPEWGEDNYLFLALTAVDGDRTVEEWLTDYSTSRVNPVSGSGNQQGVSASMSLQFLSASSDDPGYMRVSAADDYIVALVALKSNLGHSYPIVPGGSQQTSTLLSGGNTDTDWVALLPLKRTAP